MRAFNYVSHRLRRLPDTPEKIARGIWAGVFIAFTPFYGLHFILAALLARLMQGNIIASLLATFFGNPLTYLPIAATSLWFGHMILGTRPAEGFDGALGGRFAVAWDDLWHNLRAIFTDDRMEWAGLARFYDELFLPYLVGGLIPGVIAASLMYGFAVPLIGAYQSRRRKKLQAKLAQLRGAPPPPNRRLPRLPKRRG